MPGDSETKVLRKNFRRVERREWLCSAKIPFSFAVDRYNGQPANNRLTFIDALLPERGPPVIVGLETPAEMNLVQIETNEFFPQLPSSEFSRTIHYHTGPALQSSEQSALHAAILSHRYS